MHKTLIVARMAPADAPTVAGIFGDSDATELPDLLGVRRRVLFRFHDLYFHLIESETTLAERLDGVRQDPLFVDVNRRLAEHIRPYSPAWRGPRDAMAEPFYQWQSSRNAGVPGRRKG